MFGDEVAGAGVEAPRQETAENEVCEGLPAEHLHHSYVKGDLNYDVEEVDPCQGEFVDEHGAEGVE